MKLLPLLILFLPFGVFAKKQPCTNLPSCIEKVSGLTGKKYVYVDSLKGSVKTSHNFQLTKENADHFLSQVLFENGYTRIPQKTPQTYQIINARDVRYHALPMLKDSSKVSDNDDYIMYTYKLKDIDSTEITRSFRPFMSRYGRIIDLKQQNSIIVQDTGKNIKRLINLINMVDKPVSSKKKKEEEEKLEHQRELEKLRAKNGTDIKQTLEDFKKDFLLEVLSILSKKK